MPKPMGKKQCKRCEAVQHLNQFSRNKQMNDGHVNTCKSCALDMKKRSMAKHNPDWRNTYLRAWR